MTLTIRAAGAAVCLGFLLQSVAFPNQRKKKKGEEDVTQTLETPPGPPAALGAGTARLFFRVTPLSDKGLLSQQTREALRQLLRDTRGAQVIRLKAFVAGTGDLRRVPSLVGEVFAEKKQTLPVVTVVQVGRLPMEAAQIQLEATLQDRKEWNPHGIAFLAAEGSSGRLALEGLRARAASVGASEMLAVTCALPALDDAAPAWHAAQSLFPRAESMFVVAQRIPAVPAAACDAVARLDSPAPGGVRFSEGASSVSAPRLVFAGAQLAFRYQESDARLAFQRLEKTLQAAGTSLGQCVSLNAYPLSPQLAGLVRRVRLEFINRDHPPPGAMLPYEGLPSMDASFSLEAVAVAGPSSPQ